MDLNFRVCVWQEREGEQEPAHHRKQGNEGDRARETNRTLSRDLFHSVHLGQPGFGLAGTGAGFPWHSPGD